MATNWFYVKGGQKVGPVDLEAIRGLVAGGGIGPEDLIWNETMSNWTPARQVPEIAPATGASSSYVPPQYGAPARAAMPQAGPASAPTSGVSATPTAIEMLRQTKPWARLMGVMMFIGTGLLVLGGLVAAVAGSIGGVFGRGFGGAGFLMFFIYLAIAALYFPLGLFLNRYASRIGTLLNYQRPEDLEGALQAQKSFWKYVGILTVVMLCLYAVIIVIAIIVGAFAASRF